MTVDELLTIFAKLHEEGHGDKEVITEGCDCTGGSVDVEVDSTEVCITRNYVKDGYAPRATLTCCPRCDTLLEVGELERHLVRCPRKRTCERGHTVLATDFERHLQVCGLLP